MALFAARRPAASGKAQRVQQVIAGASLGCCRSCVPYYCQLIRVEYTINSYGMCATVHKYILAEHEKDPGNPQHIAASLICRCHGFHGLCTRQTHLEEATPSRNLLPDALCPGHAACWVHQLRPSTPLDHRPTPKSRRYDRQEETKKSVGTTLVGGLTG